MFPFFPNSCGFSVFPGLFGLVFVSVLGIIIFAAVRGFSQWSRNNHSPQLTVWAHVVAKRTRVDHHHQASGVDPAITHHSTSTTYYATFQVQSGDRMELRVNGKQYGLLAEGDFGSLTFQGTRFLGFERQAPTQGGC